MSLRIIFLLLAGVLLPFCISTQPEAGQISMEDLLPQTSELPANWSVVWSCVDAEKARVVTSLVYLPTGGRAWLWIYQDENRSIFDKGMGWGKEKGSLIKRLSYRGVYIYRYRTWMGYDRYLTHTGGYTFIFDSGEYATDTYSVSGAPRDEGDELFKQVVSHALEKGVRAEMVEPKEEQTSQVKTVERLK